MLVEAVIAIVALSVLVIGKKGRGVAAERVLLRPRILLQIGVLIEGEILVGGGGIIARAGIVREQSYTDISNIRIIKMRILYLLSRYFS